MTVYPGFDKYFMNECKNQYYIINEAKRLFFEKINKSDKPLARLASQNRGLNVFNTWNKEKLSSL